MANEVAVRVGGLTVGALQNVAENRHIITSDGELLDVTLATDDDLVIWSLVTQRLRTLARNIEQASTPNSLTAYAEQAGRSRHHKARLLRQSVEVPCPASRPHRSANCSKRLPLTE